MRRLHRNLHHRMYTDRYKVAVKLLIENIGDEDGLLLSVGVEYTFMHLQCG